MPQKRKAEDVLADLDPTTLKKVMKLAEKQSKEAKKKKDEDKFHCEDYLMEWYENNTIWKELESRTTQQLKCICAENGVARSEPKYEIRTRLIEHAKMGVRRREASKVAASGDPAAPLQVAISKFQSFEAARNYAMKHFEKMETGAGTLSALYSY
jgi:hypothetical protein